MTVRTPISVHTFLYQRPLYGVGAEVRRGVFRANIQSLNYFDRVRDRSMGTHRVSLEALGHETCRIFPTWCDTGMWSLAVNLLNTCRQHF